MCQKANRDPQFRDIKIEIKRLKAAQPSFFACFILTRFGSGLGPGSGLGFGLGLRPCLDPTRKYFPACNNNGQLYPLEDPTGTLR